MRGEIEITESGLSVGFFFFQPSSKNTIIQALEKAKPNLPARPQPKAKGSTAGAGGRGGPAERQLGSGTPGGGAKGGGAASAGKKGLRAPSATRGVSFGRQSFFNRHGNVIAVQELVVGFITVWCCTV